MTNLEKYQNVFCSTFELANEQLTGLKYQDVKLWDSVGHMTLIANLEEVFDIMMETDDIINLSSFERGMEILKENYDIKI
jgi:acyl carrier protein